MSEKLTEPYPYVSIRVFVDCSLGCNPVPQRCSPAKCQAICIVFKLNLPPSNVNFDIRDQLSYPKSTKMGVLCLYVGILQACIGILKPYVDIL